MHQNASLCGIPWTDAIKFCKINLQVSFEKLTEMWYMSVILTNHSFVMETRFQTTLLFNMFYVTLAWAVLLTGHRVSYFS